MSRRIGLGLLALSCLGLLACGDSASSDASADAGAAGNAGADTGTVELTLWGAEDDAALLQEIVSGFEAEYSDVEFAITIEAVAESDCKSSLFADVNHGPDVFTFADDQLSTLAASGVLKPLENADEISGRNLSGAVDAASVNGQLYAYPLTADNGYFMFYNKEYFQESDLETLDGMLAVAASNGKKITFDVGNAWYFYSFYGNTGLEVGLNADGISNYCTWNSTENAITGLNVASAIADLGSNSGFLNGGDSVLLAGAKDGSVIAGVSGVWLATELEAAWGANYGAVKLPTYTVAGQQVQMASYAGYKLVGVNAYSDEKEWAEKLADWMTNEKNQTLRFEMRSQGPSNSVAASSEAVANSPALTALINQSAYSSLQRVGSAYWGPAAELAAALMAKDSGGLSWQEYLDKIVAEITASN